jgi:glucosamine-phosphate N-acetyltransferase
MEVTLFSTALISKEVSSTLPAGYTLRPLQSGDYDRGVLKVLEVLTTVGNISKFKFQGIHASYIPIYISERFEWLQKRNDSYFTIVIENDQNTVVGVGSLLVEAKLLISSFNSVLSRSIHECAIAGHIEDIAVAKSEQGKKLGLKIIQALLHISEAVGCYKTTLVCADHNVKFYEKCGMVKGQNEMVIFKCDEV